MTDRIWSIADLSHIRFKAWGEGDDTVAFSMRSGDTHLLTQLPMALLSALQQTSASVQDLIAHVPLQIEGRSDEDVAEIFESTLIELKEMGFIALASS